MRYVLDYRILAIYTVAFLNSLNFHEDRVMTALLKTRLQNQLPLKHRRLELQGIFSSKTERKYSGLSHIKFSLTCTQVPQSS